MLFHNNQEVKATQIFIKEWMDKENIGFSTMEYFTALKRRNPATCCNTGEFKGHLIKISQSPKDKYCMMPLTWHIKCSQNHGIRKIERWLSRASGERELVLSGFQCWKMNKFSRSFAQQLWRYLTLLKCALTTIKMVNLVCFYHNRKVLLYVGAV